MELGLFDPSVSQLTLARKELSDCERFLSKYELALTPAQKDMLVNGRFESLKKYGRAEFKGGVLPALLYAFCDSPYIEIDNFAETVAELQDIFYYFKAESREQVSDERVIACMRAAFDGFAHGHTQLLADASFEMLFGDTEKEAEQEDDDE